MEATGKQRGCLQHPPVTATRAYDDTGWILLKLVLLDMSPPPAPAQRSPASKRKRHNRKARNICGFRLLLVGALSTRSCANELCVLQRVEFCWGRGDPVKSMSTVSTRTHRTYPLASTFIPARIPRDRQLCLSAARAPGTA
eukprot:14069441-Alexandrium_andersonii.AAC.2